MQLFNTVLHAFSRLVEWRLFQYCGKVAVKRNMVR